MLSQLCSLRCEGRRGVAGLRQSPLGLLLQFSNRRCGSARVLTASGPCLRSHRGTTTTQAAAAPVEGTYEAEPGAAASLVALVAAGTGTGAGAGAGGSGCRSAAVTTESFNGEDCEGRLFSSATDAGADESSAAALLASRMGFPVLIVLVAARVSDGAAVPGSGRNGQGRG